MKDVRLKIKKTETGKELKMEDGRWKMIL